MKYLHFSFAVCINVRTQLDTLQCHGMWIITHKTSVGLVVMENSHICYILVVDDLADNLVLIRTVLEAEGYIVDVADSGTLALAKVEASLPDLILVDLMMPDIDGFEVTRRLRQNAQFSSVPILIVTADRTVEEEQGLEVGANGFIRKPVDFDELLEKIEAFC